MLARENPFRVERLHALRFRYPEGDGHEALLARVMAHGGRSAIVGPHGSGKTTLMLELGPVLRARGYAVRALRLGAERRSLSRAEWRALTEGLGPRDAILLDGAGHLRPWTWIRLRRASRRAGILIVTAHRAHRGPVALRTATSPELLRELVAELDSGSIARAGAELFGAVHGDLRRALRWLFDQHVA